MRSRSGEEIRSEGTCLVEQRLDFAFASRFAVLEGVCLGAVKVGLARCRHKDA